MVARCLRNDYSRRHNNARGAMIILAAILLGAALGWRRAGRLGGDRRDRAQYAAAFAMAFAAIGLFATVIIDRMI